MLLHMTTSTFGCYAIQIDIGRVCQPHCFSRQVGKGRGGIHHPIQPKEEWGNHQFSNPSHWWGRRGEFGHGDGFLSPWSDQDRGLWCPLHLTPMWLIKDKCGSGRMILQHSLHSYRDVPFTLSGCEHPPRGYCFNPFPLDRLHLCQLLPLMILMCCYHVRRGRKAGNVPLSPWGTMGEFWGGTSSFQSNSPISPHVGSSSPSGRVHTDWGRIWQPSCQYPDRRVRVSSLSQTSTGSQ